MLTHTESVSSQSPDEVGTERFLYCPFCSLSPWTWQEGTAHMIKCTHDTRQDPVGFCKLICHGDVSQGSRQRPASMLVPSPGSWVRPVHMALEEGGKENYYMDRREGKETVISWYPLFATG